MVEKCLDSLIEKHVGIFGKDLGGDLARDFVRGVYRAAGISYYDKREILKKGGEVFHSLSEKVYGPVFCAFTDWVLSSCDSLGERGKILFMARDAIPLYVIAKTFIQGGRYNNLSKKDIGEVYFTRKLVGDSDEIAGFGNADVNQKMVKDYLEGSGVNPDSLLVDMGLYGSLYNKGDGLYWDEGEGPGMVFFYSKNPNITGFLNLVIDEYGLGDDFAGLANKLVDGGECVNPQRHLSPGALGCVDGVLSPSLELIDDDFIQVWHEDSLRGYVDAAKKYMSGDFVLEDEMRRLKGLSDVSGGVWNGILPETTPEWSMKKDFLENTDEYFSKMGSSGWNVGKVELSDKFYTLEGFR